MPAKLHFYGGAGTVTGANYLLEIEGVKIIIDCGLFQGNRFAEEQNHEPFFYDPKTIDAVFITHAHADHIGRLPKMHRDGYRGPIYSTDATRDLTEVMLHDALKIMKHERDAYHTRDDLYSENDLEGTLSLFRALPYSKPLSFHKDITVTPYDSAHILGSAMFQFQTPELTVTFTGDLGNTPAPLLNAIQDIGPTDYLLMESVYGNRIHETGEERKLLLERAIENAVTSGGTIIIPVFALERTQAMLAELNELIEHNRIPRIPIFLDSPLAINATRVYKKYEHLFNTEMRQTIRSGDDLFSFPGLRFTASREESQTINAVPAPKLIMAGNPHGYGSRIAYHFERYLPDPKSTVIFVGYPRISSLGRQLVDGRTSVRIFDRSIPVRANILNISGYSAHADQNQLKTFVSRIPRPIKKIFIAMGEPASSSAISHVLRDELGIHTHVPQLRECVELESAAIATTE